MSGVTYGPAMFRHATDAYKAMKVKAKKRTIDGKPTLVYEGHVVKTLLSNTAITTGTYSAVIELLKTMGCISQLVRGSGLNNPSVIALLQEPTASDFDDAVTFLKPTERIGGRPVALPSIHRRIAALKGELKALQRLGKFDVSNSKGKG